MLANVWDIRALGNCCVQSKLGTACVLLPLVAEHERIPGGLPLAPHQVGGGQQPEQACCLCCCQRSVHILTIRYIVASLAVTGVAGHGISRRWTVQLIRSPKRAL
jgi:hypothetical protein